MAYSFVRQTEGSSGGTGQATVQSAIAAGNNTVGNVYCWVVEYYSGSARTFTIAAASTMVAGDFVQQNAYYSASKGYGRAWGYAIVPLGKGGVAERLTATFDAPADFPGIMFTEFSGLDIAALFTTGEAVGQLHSAPGVLTDAITTGVTPTLATAPCLVFALASDITVGFPPVAGTVWNSRASIWATSDSQARPQDMRVTTTTALEALWTAQSGHGSDDYGTSLIVLKEAAGGSSNTTITPAVGSLGFTGYAPTVTLGAIKPATANLSLTGQAPVVTQQFVKTPASGSLSLVGATPQVQILGTVRPNSGALALTGFAPTVIQAHVRTPGTASLSIVGQTPLIGAPKIITPGSGALGFVGYAPTQDYTGDAPQTGALGLTGYAPFVGRGTSRSPSVGTLTLVGQTPVVRQNQTITPGTGTLVLTGVAPVRNGDLTIRPPAGALTLAGQLPFVQGVLTIRPGTATLGLTGFSPVLQGQNILRPAVATLTLSGVAPVVSRGTVIRPGTGALSAIGQTPAVRVPIIIRPPTGELVLSGQLAVGGGTGGGDGTDGGTGLVLRRPARQALRRPIRSPVRTFNA